MGARAGGLGACQRWALALRRTTSEQIVTTRSWQPVSRPPATLVDARQSLHWAAQLLGAAADAVLEPAVDDSHTNLHWSDNVGGLVGNRFATGHQVGLRFAPLTIVLREGDAVIRSFELTGYRLYDALEWLAEQLSEILERPVELALRDYEMPPHPVSQGTPFAADMTEALLELGRYFADADMVLDELAASDPRATAVAGWPHHFDLGGILILADEQPFDVTSQVGFGFSPGDSLIEQPYYYVTPSPFPEEATLPALDGGGTWQRQGFAGAVLPASRIISVAGDRQRAAIRAFLRSAVDAAMVLTRADVASARSSS